MAPQPGTGEFDSQRQVSAVMDDRFDQLDGLGFDAVRTDDSSQQLGGLGLVQYVQGQQPRLVQAGQSSAAGDDDPAAGRGRQQRLDLRLVRCVIQYQQHPPVPRQTAEERRACALVRRYLRARHTQ